MESKFFPFRAIPFQTGAKKKIFFFAKVFYPKGVFILLSINSLNNKLLFSYSSIDLFNNNSNNDDDNNNNNNNNNKKKKKNKNKFYLFIY